ncbi:MAG: hypothetical protein HZB51_14645 [Chloroflexi bacterium]|nr:hypothetical protein [Chloroflexota bacterium]
MNRKTLVILAGAIMLIALFALTFAPVQQVAAQGPTATPVPPVAKLQVLAMPGNAAAPGAITATIKYVTETNAASSNVALYTNGLSNVPINVPVYVQVSAVDPKNSGNAVWSLTKPAESKSVITNVVAITTAMVAKFTPDVVGAYYVQVQLRNAANVTSAPQFAFFNAGTYIGVDKGNCKTCHPMQTNEWAKTGHALVFQEELDNKIDGPAGVAPSAAGYITHYSETCTRCHTTGWYPAPYNGSGGYWDAKAKANWTFPTWKQIDEVFTKKAPSNWQAAPAEVKNMGAIGCETCHGPANEHVAKGAKVMAVTFDSGVCNQCHGAAANHSKGWQLGNSGHGDTAAHAWEIAGPEEQGCVRCHTPEGFASFLKNPKNQAAWSNEEGTLGCAGCHDPHSEETPFQLRIVGKPVEVPFAAVKDVGLSASCETCHNGRRDGDAFAAGKTTSYPHYSNAAEMLSDTGGITYGATVPNSPHGMMVGNAPVPSGSTTPGSAKFKWSSPTDTKGNVPGPCVYCHMWDAVTTATDPLAYKVGGHSFNTVTPDGKTDYGSSCKSCHGEVKDFNLKAKADYDGNTKVEGVQDEVKGLLNATWKALEAKGFKKVETGNPYATIPADADAKTKQAWFNFRYVYGVMWGPETGNGNEGKAAAIHNFKRTCALLQLSLKDLGATPAGAADCTK